MIKHGRLPVSELDSTRILCTLPIRITADDGHCASVRELLSFKSKGDMLTSQINTLRSNWRANAETAPESYCALMDSIMLNGRLMQYVGKVQKLPLYIDYVMCAESLGEVYPCCTYSFSDDLGSFFKTLRQILSHCSDNKVLTKYEKFHKVVACFAAMRTAIDMALVTQNKCSFCLKKPDVVFLCDLCRRMRYCSEECQKKSWKDGHSAVCGKC